jgi:hypothetical protein
VLGVAEGHGNRAALGAIRATQLTEHGDPTRVTSACQDCDKPPARWRIKTKNPNYWRRDSEREAMRRSRERRQRTRV